jgi:hypothetical protein
MLNSDFSCLIVTKKTAIMKYFIFSLFILFISCNSEPSPTEKQQKEFEDIARSYQTKYMGGSENCEYILNAMDENIKMSEIRFGEPSVSFSYDLLTQFCPHLPKKEVIETTTEQRLFNPGLGYDYVSQLYLRKSLGDTVRETSTKIWEKKDGKWKIIHMNSSLNKACDH